MPAEPLHPVPVTRVTTRRVPWALVLAVGAAVTVAALGLLVWPFVAARWVLALLLGAAIIAGGLALLVRARPSLASTAIGVALVLAGMLAIVFSAFTVQALVTLVGAGLAVAGAVWIAAALRLGAGIGGLAAVPGGVLLVAGIVALVWPAIALALASVVAGLCLLVLGVSTIGLALRLRRARVTSATTIVR